MKPGYGRFDAYSDERKHVRTRGQHPGYDDNLYNSTCFDDDDDTSRYDELELEIELPYTV